MLAFSLTTNWYLHLTWRVCTVITPPICKCRLPQATRMSSAYDLSTWRLHVTSPRDVCTCPWYSSAHSRRWGNWTPLHGFAENTTSLERQRSVVLTRDVSRDFFRSRWASSLINLVCLFTRLTVLHLFYFLVVLFLIMF